MKKPRQLTNKPPRRDAGSPSQWQQLLRKAIFAAERAKDPRLASLQQALKERTAERTLRRMSIICEADISREFSTPTT